MLSILSDAQARIQEEIREQNYVFNGTQIFEFYSEHEGHKATTLVDRVNIKKVYDAADFETFAGTVVGMVLTYNQGQFRIDLRGEPVFGDEHFRITDVYTNGNTVKVRIPNMRAVVEFNFTSTDHATYFFNVLTYHRARVMGQDPQTGGAFRLRLSLRA